MHLLAPRVDASMDFRVLCFNADKKRDAAGMHTPRQGAGFKPTTPRMAVETAHAQSCACSPTGAISAAFGAHGPSPAGASAGTSGHARAAGSRLGTPLTTCTAAHDAPTFGTAHQDSRCSCGRLALDGAFVRDCGPLSAGVTRRERRVTFAGETVVPDLDGSRPAKLPQTPNRDLDCCDEGEIRQRLMEIEAHLWNLRKRALRQLQTDNTPPQQQMRLRSAGGLPCQRERKRNL